MLYSNHTRLCQHRSLAEIGGPPLAGGLIQLIGAPIAVLFDVLSFLVSALSVGLIRSHEIQPVAPEEKREPLWNKMHEVLHILSSHPLLRTLTIYATVRTFFGGAFAALTIYVVRELSIVPALYGVLVALGGVGTDRFTHHATPHTALWSETDSPHLAMA